MSRARGRQHVRQPRRRPLVLVFGENPHDSQSIKILVEHLNPELARDVDVEVRREPPSLTRSAGPVAARSWLEEIGDLVRLEGRRRDIRGVLVHQDADGTDAGGRVSRGLQARLGDAVSMAPSHAVVPVQELEGWWFLFPEAVRAVKPGAWRDLVLRSGDTATISSPKEELQRATRKVSSKHKYKEADSVTIAMEIAARGLSPAGRNHSWSAFAALCGRL